MNVSDLIALLGSLSIGLDDPSDSDIAIYLKYLNIAYTEILQATAAQSTHIPIITDTLVPAPNGEIEEGVFSQIPFIFKVVYDVTSNLPLTRTTLDSVQKNDPGLKRTGTPREWYYSSGSLWVYPTPGNSPGDIGVTYIPQPSLLDINTTSAEINIPELYQYILADGAAYYIFQSEIGFKDQTKMLASQMRWEKGKRDLFNYYKNFGGKQFFSTYSPV